MSKLTNLKKKKERKDKNLKTFDQNLKNKTKSSRKQW
jgi:hypothetical protein